MKPVQDQMWWVALDHLKEQWPVKLAELLKTNQLKEYLDQAVLQTWEMKAKLQKKLNPVEVEEAVLPVFVAPRNPDFDPDKPEKLKPEAAKALAHFRQKWELESQRV